MDTVTAAEIAWVRRNVTGPTRGITIRLLRRHGKRRAFNATRRFGF